MDVEWQLTPTGKHADGLIPAVICAGAQENQNDDQTSDSRIHDAVRGTCRVRRPDAVQWGTQTHTRTTQTRDMRHTDTQAHRHIETQAQQAYRHRHTEKHDTQTRRHADTQTHRHTDTCTQPQTQNT